MPSSFAHAAVAVIANPVLAKADRRPAVIWIAACAAAAPDLDAIGWVIHGGSGGLPSAHRGVTHSLFVALAAAALATLVSRYRWPLASVARTFGYFALVIASHGLLDCLTSYGDGVELLAPFVRDRFTSPWQPFAGLGSELLCLWLPAILFLYFNVGGFAKRPVARGWRR
ncbi:MAG TPA: metal-dependent hydrolase [Gemmatimonadaceae bacterium]|jgi:inner membrane protein